MYKPKLITSILLLSLFTIAVHAQDSKMASADKSLDKFAYVDAIKTYERVAEKGHRSVELFENLGDAYYFTANLEVAAKWYGELFTMNEEIAPEYYYRYSQSLKAIGNYKKADEMMAAFSQKNANDMRGKLYAENKDYLAIIEKNSGRYKLETVAINSTYSDYGPSYFGNKLVFTSSRDTTTLFRKIDKWTNQSFTTLYVSQINGDGTLAMPEKFSKDINAKYHESTPVFTQDGQTMYFTRNHYSKGKANSEKLVLLKIYRSTLVNGKWSEVTELPFNSNEYSTAHPALSPDGKTLYFASNMTGSFGASDIYKVDVYEDGSFGTPENLGSGINTEGRETFPFVSKTGELYFASDGHPGLGGLDVFVSKKEKNGQFLKAHNVGKPINGPQDDFALIIDTDTETGYFSSNRAEGKGYDDLYSFTEEKPLETECHQSLAGVITDKDTKQPIAGSRVSLFDADFDLIKELRADDAGKYTFEVECGQKYYIRAEKPQFNTKELSILISDKSGQANVPIALDRIVKEVKVGSDLAKTFDIEIIYFDLNKTNIRQDAALDLEKIIDVMKQNPTMKIDVRSHTDSRATQKYNQALSDKRAKATIEYMVKSGIDAGRLTGRGYGETQPVNKCKDGVECTEEEHQQNRRSEFIITEL